MDKHHQEKNPVEADFLCWTTHPGKYGKHHVISTHTQLIYSYPSHSTASTILHKIILIF